MAEELKIIIEADVSQAQQALSGIQDAASKTATSLKNVAPAANSALAATAQQAKIVQLSVSSLGRTIDDLKQKVQGKQALISTETDVRNIARLNKEIQSLQLEIQRVQNIGKSGFNEFGQASAEATDKLISGFNNAFSAVRRLAFILPGIGIAGIIGFASEAIIGFAKDLFNLSSSFDDAAIASANFQNELKSLDEFITSTKGTLDFTNEINKLKNQLSFGKGFKADILSQGFDLDALKKQFDLLGTVLDDQFKEIESRVAAASFNLGKEGKKLFDSFTQQAELIPQDLIDKLGDSDKKFLTELKSLTEQSAKINKERGTILEEIEKQNLQKQIDAHEQQLKEQKEFLQKQQQQVKAFIDAASKSFKFFEIPVELRITDFDSEIEKIRKGLDIIRGIKEFTIRLNTEIQLPEIKELPKEQVDKFFKNVPTSLQDAINKGLIDPKPLELFIQPKAIGEDAFSKEIADILKKFDDLNIAIPLSIEVDAATGKLKAGSADFLKALLDAFKPAEVEKKLQEQMQQAIDNAFANLTVEGLSNLGEAIGNALSGGDLNAGFKAFTDAVGSALESLGKQMIALSPVIVALKLAIKTLNPAILLPAGIALVAIGAALRNLIGNGLQGFAEGGEPPVNKPSIVGEKGWELFIPKVPGTIVSHEDSVNLLTKGSMSSSSVKESETIREYLIATRVSQQVKEYFNSAFTERIKEGIRLSIVPIEMKISDSVRSMATNNEKLTAYAYRLHEHSNDTIQKIISITNRESISSDHYSANESNNNSIKELLATYKLNEFHFSNSSTRDNDSLIKTDSVETFKIITNSFKESFNKVNDIIGNNFESIKYNTANDTVIDRLHNSITNSFKESFNKIIEKPQATIVDSSISYENISSSFEKVVDLLRDRATVSTSSEIDSSKESYQLLSKLIRSEKYYSSVSSAIEKLSTINDLSEVRTSIGKLHERIATINNSSEVSSSIDKLKETISERSDKSVTIERIINNNFFSSDSFKETFKSMSLTDLQKTFHIPAFAQGGAVFGPTLAILGEGFGISRGNPEFVGTRSQLSGIQGGQFDVNVNVDGELSFSMGKLAIALNREQRSSFRTSGKPGF